MTTLFDDWTAIINHADL